MTEAGARTPEAFAAAVHSRLLEQVEAGRTPPSLSEPLRRLLEGGAQDSAATHLTALPGLICSALGGDPRRAIAPAAAWRALHLAASLLDDVEDGDRPVLQGAPMRQAVAINCATALFALAHLTLPATPVDISFQMVQSINVVIVRMAGAQQVDLTARETLDLDGYEQVMRGKSGDFFGLGATLGALAAGVPETVRRQSELFAVAAGMTLQVADDLSGFRLEPPHGDLSAGARTLPMLYALAVLDPPEATRMRAMLREAESRPAVAVEVRRWIAALGGEMFTVAQLAEYGEQARRHLAALAVKDRPSRVALSRWLDRLSPPPDAP